MKRYLYLITVIVVHLVIWGKLMLDHPNIWMCILFAGYLIYLLYNRKIWRRYLFFFAVLPLEKTLYVTLIQVLFLVLVWMTPQLSLQMISLVGSLLCENIRLRTLLDQAEDQERMETWSKRMEEMNQHLLSIRSQRHDFLKHVSAIGHYIDRGSNTDAKQYFDELVGEYEEINSSIKGESAPISSILFKYKNSLKQLGTVVNEQLSVPISQLPLNRLKQVQLLENLLENAADAIHHFHARFSYSKLMISTEIHSGIYIFQIKNSAFFEDKHILDELFEKFEVSSKSGEHQGIGTYIISSVVKSHNGRLAYQFKNDELTIKIKLPIIDEQK
jgi:LytT family two-component system sensor histidine kinase NatK